MRVEAKMCEISWQGVCYEWSSMMVNETGRFVFYKGLIMEGFPWHINMNLCTRRPLKTINLRIKSDQLCNLDSIL